MGRSVTGSDRHETRSGVDVSRPYCLPPPTTAATPPPPFLPGTGIMGVQQPPLATKPKAPKPVSEARRIRKPLMERKRRERINTSLNDLATLLAEAHMVKTEAGKPTKLEKADILELTVKHIKTLKTQADAETDVDGDGVVPPTSSYKEGFSRCMGVVEQALGKAGKEALRERLLTHLQACLQTLQPPTPPHPDADDPHLPSKDASERLSGTHVPPAVKTEGGTSREGGPRLTLVPTRLPTGGVAFLVQGGIDPSLLLPQDCKVGSAKPNPSSSTSQCQANPSSSPSEPSAVTSTAATQCPNTSSATSTSAPLPTQCSPASTSLSTKCSPNSKPTSTQCPSVSPSSTQCSATPIAIQCPPTPPLSTQCPPTPPISTQCPPTPPLSTQCPPTPPLSTQCPPTPPLSTQCPPTPPLSTQCPPTPPLSTKCPPTPPLSTQCPPTPPLSTQCPPSPISIQCPPTPHVSTQCPLTPLISTQCPHTPPELTQCPPTPPISTQYPPTPLIPTQSSSTSTLTSTQYPPTSTNHCTSTSITIQYPPTSILTQCSSTATLTQRPPDPRAFCDQGQPSPSVMTYYNPTHATHIPPTPPPSVSPQTPLHHPCQLQAVYSEEEMDTDGEYEGEIEVDDEGPYDLSMRRMWRPW